MAIILKAVAPARGAQWLREGLRLFIKQPLAFTGLFLMYLAAVLLLAAIPLFGGFLVLATLPLLSLGFMVASRSVLAGGKAGARHFVEPLRGNAAQRRSLLLLCVVYAGAVLLAILLCDLVGDGVFSKASSAILAAMRQGAQRSSNDLEGLLADRNITGAVILLSLILGLLSVPLWHAPALVHWGAQGAWQAMFSSVISIWRSRGAFLVYGLALFVLMQLLGLLSVLVGALFGASLLSVLLTMAIYSMASAIFYVSLIFSFDDSFGSAPSPGLG